MRVKNRNQREHRSYKLQMSKIYLVINSTKKGNKKHNKKSNPSQSDQKTAKLHLIIQRRYLFIKIA